MLRPPLALGFVFAVTACVSSEPVESPDESTDATGGAGGAPPNEDGSGGQVPVDGGADGDAQEDAEDDPCLPDGSLFGTGVCDSGTSTTDAASDPCFQAIAWVSDTPIEPHLMPGDYVTLNGILYQFTGTEQQWALADCGPDAPVSWCPDSGWIWQQVGTC